MEERERQRLEDLQKQDEVRQAERERKVEERKEKKARKREERIKRKQQVEHKVHVSVYTVWAVVPMSYIAFLSFIYCRRMEEGLTLGKAM